MVLQGRKVLVVGSGKTGIATARFCLARGARVTLNDRKAIIEAPQDLLDAGLALAAGGHDSSTFLSHDVIVLSPGVSLHIPPVVEARKSGIEVISEIELAFRFLKAPLIAVTGTNGKTTTTSLIAALLQAGGKKVFVGGNIGTPLIDCCGTDTAYDYIVAEVSSFQLEAVSQFRPAISVLLNITDDHLDRHDGFAAYRAAKARIFENQHGSDIAILSADDDAVASLAPSVGAVVFFFSQSRALEHGAWYDGLLHFSRGDGSRSISLDAGGACLQGTHNIENMLAAGLVGVLCGLPVDEIREALVSFKGLEHRMEFVDELKGVKFFNDSKGTNVGAVVKSLESLAGPVILIAGGKDKGGSYKPLEGPLKSKGKALVVLGEARHRIADSLGHSVPTVIVDSLDAAVREAFRLAAPGDSVLFSPACASFDMFSSYAHRGRCFVDSVKQLKR